MKTKHSFFIRRPVISIIIIAALCVIGFISYLNLPVSDLPNVGYPVITVTASDPGATPQTVADTIATPLERELSKISGVKNIISLSSEGFTKIIITFDLSRDENSITPDIETAISNAESYLPILNYPPQFQKYNPADTPIMYIVVNSNSIPHGDLFNLVNNQLASPLNMLNGVSSATIWSVSSAMHITLNPKKMAAYNLTVSDVDNVIKNNNINISEGSLSNQSRTFAIESSGMMTSPEEYNNLILKYTDGVPLKLSNIGKAFYGPEQENYLLDYHYSKNKEIIKNPIMIAVTAKNSANVIHLTNEINNLVKNVKNELPNTLSITIPYSKANIINSSIEHLKITLLISFLLIIAIIFLLVGSFRGGIIPVIIIPCSILGTFIVMIMTKASIDNLSLLAMILAVGFIVDDSIVVIENSYRLIQTGIAPFEAAVKSMSELTGAITSMSLSLIIVFVPLFFMKGIIAENLKEFAIVIIASVAISYCLSLTITPMLCSTILHGNNKNKLSELFNKIIEKLLFVYEKSLNIFLNFPILSLILFIFSCLFLFISYSYVGKDFIPNGNSGNITGTFQLPLGTSDNVMQEYQKELNAKLKNNPLIKNFMTITGIYTGADQATGNIIINLSDKTKKMNINKLVSSLSQNLSQTGNNSGNIYLSATPVISINSGGNNTAYGSEYSYMLTGNNNIDVLAAADVLYNKLKKSSIFMNVQTSVIPNLPTLKIITNREKAASLGISEYSLENELQNAFTQNIVTQYTEGINRYDVIVSIESQNSKNPNDLNNIYIRSENTGKLIPFSSVAKVEEISSPKTVTHYQLLNAATISFDIAPGYSVNQGEKVIKEISTNDFKAGINGAFEGKAGLFSSLHSEIYFAVFLALIAMYFMLGIFFESLLHPLTVMATIPSSLLGGIILILFTGSNFNLFAYITMLLLVGITVKNSILITDFALKKDKKDGIINSITYACRTRFRPILMTGLTSFLGAVPLIIFSGPESDIRKPVGLAIIGGIILSQMLTLYITPGIFIIMDNIQKKYLNRFRLLARK